MSGTDNKIVCTNCRVAPATEHGMLLAESDDKSTWQWAWHLCKPCVALAPWVLALIDRKGE